MIADKIMTPATQHTTDYKQFKMLHDNRPIFRTHVQELVTSFREHPELIELRPILVNDQMEVVDGQHRLEAAKFLKIAVPYQVVPKLDIATAQLMNALQRSWRLIDFIHSYSGSGRPEYQKIERWLDDYSPIGPSVVLAYAVESYNKKSFKQAARLGQIKLLSDKEVEDRLEKLSSLPVPFWYYDSFASAFLRVLRTVENYDHKRMLAGIEAAEIHRQPTTMDSLRELERAYNWKKSVDIVRFF